VVRGKEEMIRIIAFMANILMFVGFTGLFMAQPPGELTTDFQWFLIVLVFIVPVINIIALWPSKKRAGEHEGKE
jgi:hypothetical protein